MNSELLLISPRHLAFILMGGLSLHYRIVHTIELNLSYGSWWLSSPVRYTFHCRLLGLIASGSCLNPNMNPCMFVGFKCWYLMRKLTHKIPDHWIQPISKKKKKKKKNRLHTVWRTRSYVKLRDSLQFINLKSLIFSSPYQTLIHIIIFCNWWKRALTTHKGFLYISLIDRRRGPRIHVQNRSKRVIRITILFLLILLLLF